MGSIFILFAETTLDKNKGGYPLFGNVALTTCVIISEWTFTASVFLSNYKNCVVTTNSSFFFAQENKSMIAKVVLELIGLTL